MRIVAGSLKGRLLNGPPKGSQFLRPSSDRLREALFNFLIHQGLDFSGTRGLDLYAGTGALGIEAISRGAKKVLWVDNNLKSIKIIRENLQNLNLASGHYSGVWHGDCLEFFNSKPLEEILPLKWVFLDPPYESKEIPVILAKIAEMTQKKSLLEKQAWLVLECAKRDSFPYSDHLNMPFEYLPKRVYGDTALHIWKWCS